MGTEIERKYLADKDILFGYIESYPMKCYTIQQVYINDAIRLRREEHSNKEVIYTITVKSTGTTLCRTEETIIIPNKEGEKLYDAISARGASDGGILKTRYLLQHGEDDLVWEIDVFHGSNEGLIIAEIEVPNKEYKLRRHPIMDKEVTGEAKYYNRTLAMYPYSKWSENNGTNGDQTESQRNSSIAL